MSYEVQLAERFLRERTFEIFDHFDHYVTADMWTTTASNSGTVAVQEAVNGILKVNPSSNGGNSQAVNDETYVESTHELFKLATDKPMFFAARVRPVGNTIANQALMVGLIDAVAANAIVDTTGVPKTSTDAVLFYKSNTDATWYAMAEANSTEMSGITDGVDTNETATNNQWQNLTIRTVPKSSTLTEVHFGFALENSSDGSYSIREVGQTLVGKQLVCQTITHTSAAEMAVVLGVKAGVAGM